MSESKHSDSEFYYPGELSDAEMLQLPIHNVVNWKCARNETIYASRVSSFHVRSSHSVNKYILSL